MANVYGIANNNTIPVFAQLIGGANVACPANTETNIFQFTITAPPAPGWYYPFFWGIFAFSNGATPITFWTINGRLNNGADFSQMTVAQPYWGANVTGATAFWMPNTAQLFLNPTGAQNFQISCTPATGSTTALIAGSYTFAQWVRAPDQ